MWQLRRWSERRPRPPKNLRWLRRSDGALLWRERSLNVLFGDSEHGKGWAQAITALQAVREGATVFSGDWEEVEDPQIYSRMATLGATSDELDRVVTPDVDMAMPLLSFKEYGEREVSAAYAQLLGQLRDLRVDLVMLDSSNEIAGAQGIDDTNNTEWAWLRQHLIGPLQSSSTVLLLDHVGWSTGARTRGAHGKKGGVDGAWVFAWASEPLTAGHEGRINLAVMKGRHRELRRQSIRAQLKLPGENRASAVDVWGTVRLQPLDDAGDRVNGTVEIPDVDAIASALNGSNGAKAVSSPPPAERKMTLLRVIQQATAAGDPTAARPKPPGTPPSQRLLARHTGWSPHTVSDWIGRCIDEGTVRRAGQGGVTLTDFGRQLVEGAPT